MPSLFERPYRAAATTELERATREIEDRDKKAQTRKDFDEATSNVNSNINFAERLNLISAEQAEAYRERIKKATEARQQIRAAEQQEDTRERTEQLMSMEEIQAQISRERASENAQQAQSQQSQSAHPHAKDEDDGTRTH